jgi:hypothetical protein
MHDLDIKVFRSRFDHPALANSAMRAHIDRALQLVAQATSLQCGDQSPRLEGVAAGFRQRGMALSANMPCDKALCLKTAEASLALALTDQTDLP